MLKRLFDMAVSFVAIVLIAPLLVPVMVFLRFTGEGEVFYTQCRVGRGGEPFELMKFATMLKDSPNMKGGDITVDKDPRILPFGRFLRKTKINELPQLFNILKGNMSIVGPRPLTPRNFAFYSPAVRDIIGRMRPGLTGVGSIVFRNEESIIAASQMEPERCYREVIAPYKGLLETWYSENMKFSLDLWLILITAWIVLFPRSALYRKTLKAVPAPPDEFAAIINRGK